METDSQRGKQAAAVFKAFTAGKPMREIVVDLEIDPARVRELYAEWNRDLYVPANELRVVPDE